MKKIKLSASITRNYGRVGATFGAETETEVSGDMDASRQWLELVGLIHFQFEEFEANILKTEARDVSPATGNLPGNRETFKATFFTLEVKQGGKKFYSIQTEEPAFSRFGAACYPDFLERYPSLVNDLAGDYKLALPPGTLVTVDKSGKHKKCVHLTFGKA